MAENTKQKSDFTDTLSTIEKSNPFSSMLSVASLGKNFKCIGGNKTLVLFQLIALQKTTNNKFIFIFSSYDQFEDFALVLPIIPCDTNDLGFFTLGDSIAAGFSGFMDHKHFIDAQGILDGSTGSYFTTKKDYDFLLNYAPGPNRSVKIVVNNILNIHDFEKSLVADDYSRVYQTMSHNEYSIRGCIMDFFPKTSAHPIRIEMNGNKVVSMRTFSSLDQLSITTLNHFTLRFNNTRDPANPAQGVGRGVYNYTPVYVDTDTWTLSVGKYAQNTVHTINFDSVICSQPEKGPVGKPPNQNTHNVTLGRGFPSFELPGCGIKINVLGGIPVKQNHFLYNQKPTKTKNAFLENLIINEPVLHKHHGIGLYRGLETILSRDGHGTENVIIEYGDGGNVYVPIEKLNLLYPPPNSESIKLDNLSKRAWRRKIADAGLGAADLAKTILNLYTLRKKEKNRSYSNNIEYEKEVSRSFPHQLTEGQNRALGDIKTDLLSPYPMNRLLVGDVGFGKTEVIMRSVVMVVTGGFQAVILAPTTLLSDQHFFTFKARLDPLGIRVGLLSRFVSGARRKNIIQEFVNNKIDVLIGTHSILKAEINTNNLGIIIIDEEHRFGVKQKDELLVRHPMIDFLTISATPLPRTLQKSLSGFISASTLTEPPPGRMPVTTHIKYFDDDWFARAIQKEIDHGGQVIVIQNKVNLLSEYKEKIEKLTKGAVVEVIHGKLSSKSLEDTFLRFFAGETNVICGTTIVESGLDIPSVNTIIICDAQNFGLSQLHQLRGRAGRSTVRAGCYLSIPRNSQLSASAKTRLKSIEENWSLGSGFAISQKDLELRGPGEIFGAKQSGNIRNIGYSLFVDLLEEALGKKNQNTSLVLLINAPISIPPFFIKDDSVRLGFYSRILSAKNFSDLALIEGDIKDRFGSLPDETKTLFAYNKIKVAVRGLGFKTIKIGKDDISISANKNTIKNTSEYVEGGAETIKRAGAVDVRLTIVPKYSSLENNIQLLVRLGEHLIN